MAEGWIVALQQNSNTNRASVKKLRGAQMLVVHAALCAILVLQCRPPHHVHLRVSEYGFWVPGGCVQRCQAQVTSQITTTVR